MEIAKQDKGILGKSVEYLMDLTQIVGISPRVFKPLSDILVYGGSNKYAKERWREILKSDYDAMVGAYHKRHEWKKFTAEGELQNLREEGKRFEKE